MEFLTAHGADLLFYLFAALAVAGALGVVTLRNPMYGAVSLLLTFLSVAALFLLRHAEFLGIVQIFVYGGGIMVLFLFVIMLVNLHRLPAVNLFSGSTPFAALFAVALLAFFGYFIVHLSFDPALTRPEVFTMVRGENLGNSQAVAWSLYTTHLLPFEIASVFLLIAMIGAVVLGRRQ
ncbi:MAG TPA: NADH-quinone oxidoreductase subunit J [Thermoanaerobaculia bacterium]|jgi:NADH-quinone oxidoreductase subunit J|nr:NADH-quinone oxidoreductase subunit J [Thermoanaerobaculia bacterium]